MLTPEEVTNLTRDDLEDRVLELQVQVTQDAIRLHELSLALRDETEAHGQTRRTSMPLQHSDVFP